jgi:hypothetical protein
MPTQTQAFDASSSIAVESLIRDHSTVPAQPRRQAEHPWPTPEKIQGLAHHPLHSAHAEDANVWARGLDWPIVSWISFAHVGALGALYFFTWKAVALFAILFWLTGALGVCMGYHRLLTHGSFTTYRPIRWLFALLGSLSGEGSAITWVATHRKHHAHSDKDGDPHSPRDGGLWAHFLWLMPNHGAKYHADMTARYAPDLVKDPMMRFLHSTFLVWHWVLGIALFMLLNSAAICVYAERRIASFIQNRVGPNRVGPYGLLQPLADVVKLLLKEDVTPIHGSRFIHTMAPVIPVVAKL